MRSNVLSAIGIAIAAALTFTFIAAGFTSTERDTIKRMKARITALEQQAERDAASWETLAADIDTIVANQDVLDDRTAALDAGLSELVADGGPIWQIDHNLAMTQEIVFEAHPPIALTDINPIVACDGILCTVDVEWNSEPPATGQVEWGETTAYGNLTTKEEDLLGYHKQRIGVFAEDGSTYHFRVLAEIPDTADVASVDVAVSASQ